MTELKIYCLYSGSGGNCLYLESEGARVLIDAGKSARTLTSSLSAIGVSPSEIDGIFITHEHTDHVSALATLSKKYGVRIHAPKATARELLKKNDYISGCIEAHEPIFSVRIGDISVESFLTSHDSACPVGYKIKNESGDSFGHMTDTGIVTNSAAAALEGCRRVVLEANHDPDMLKNGPYPYYLKERVASRFGHLSNGLSARFAAYLESKGTEGFMLAHLSRENNTPELALSAVRAALQRNDTMLLAARQDEIVKFDL